MDLKQFITETLTQIVEGIHDAQVAIAKGGSGAQVNPTIRSERSQQSGSQPSMVEFDVALTVTIQEDAGSSERAGAKAGILNVFSANVDIEGKQGSQSKDETVSRVKFSVKLAQPADVIVSRTPNVPSTSRYLA